MKDKLNSGEEKYRRLFELESDAIILVDNETGNILEANEAACELYGYSRDTLLQMKHTDLSAEPEETRRVTMAGETFVPVRWHRKKDETVFPVEIAAKHFLWQGRPVHIAAIRDITDRVRADEALRESEERYRSLIDHNPDGVYSFDTQGVFLSVNDAACNLSGYSREEFMQMNFGALIAPEDADAVWRYFEKALNGEPQNYETTIISKDGCRVILNVTNTPITVKGEIMGVYGIAKDITRSKQAEESLRANEEKYRLHFENVSDVIFSYNRELRILSVSPSLERVLGYKPEEFIGKLVPELNVLPAESLENAFSNAMRIFDGEVAVSSVYEFIARDGTRKYGEVSNSPLLRDGQVVGVVSVARDITERKQAEEKLRITQLSVDCAAEPVAWVGKDGRYLYANDAFCRLLNYSREEILSLKTFDLAPDISAENWPEYWRKIKQQEVSLVESYLRAKDGIFIPVEINTKYLTYGDKEFLVTFLRDIRERKLRDEQLKRQVDRLAALRAIDMAITASLDIRVTFNIFLEQVVNNLHVDAADVLVLNSHSYNKLTFVAGL